MAEIRLDINNASLSGMSCQLLDRTGSCTNFSITLLTSYSFLRSFSSLSNSLERLHSSSSFWTDSESDTLDALFTWLAEPLSISQLSFDGLGITSSCTAIRCSIGSKAMISGSGCFTEIYSISMEFTLRTSPSTTDLSNS